MDHDAAGTGLPGGFDHAFLIPQHEFPRIGIRLVQVPGVSPRRMGAVETHAEPGTERKHRFAELRLFRKAGQEKVGQNQPVHAVVTEFRHHVPIKFFRDRPPGPVV